MRLDLRFPLLLASLALLVPSVVEAAPQGPTRVVSWNDLGMHCLDPDFSVFSLLPPYNTLHAQLMVGGRLQHLPGSYTVTYHAIADPTGSVNRTSIGKTNFWTHVRDLFGVSPAPDVGLAAYGMPGSANAPQLMGFDTAWSWFQAVGIPITPYDDVLQKNSYPLMGVTIRNAANQIVATTMTTVPVSDEMSCRECHASYGNPFARPQAGWIADPDPLRDERLNILRLHDERNAGDPDYVSALAAAGYSPSGLLATVQTHGTPVMCDRCHFSNALGIGMLGIEPMTQAIHDRHRNVMDASGTTLDANSSRSSCYTCHPGNRTQCLRGAMGKAIAPSGDFAMQCQSCHGDMGAVGASSRNGWFEEPVCQNCHTGSATHNNGQIRYTTAFDANGQPRQAVSGLFATTPDVPVGGYSLYRFSTGHGGLQCSACHGSPHAIYPTSVANDNLQTLSIQGHEGTLSDCSACHSNLADSQVLGPHGLHPLDANWVDDLHGDLAETSLAGCLACHGGDARGTVLSRAQGDRTFATPYGAKHFWRGFQISCYACHNGPGSSSPSPNQAPGVTNRALAMPADLAGLLTLSGTDGNNDPLTFRIVSQPAHGKVALIGAQSTYRAEAGFTGTDTFTYAAWDGKANSNLGTVTVSVTAPDCAGGAEAFGFGSVGAGDFVPRLFASGCVERGGNGAFVLDDAVGGSVAILAVGFGRAESEYYPGSVLRMNRVLFHVGGIPVTGSGAGQGGFVLPFAIPATLPRMDVVLQAFVRDGAAGMGWAASNGLELHIR